MTSQEKANWIRRLFSLTLIGAAVAGGLFFVIPDGWWKGWLKKPKSGLQVTRENLAAIQSSPGKLAVTNMMLDGNPDAEKLKVILEQLKKDNYGDKPVLDIKPTPASKPAAPGHAPAPLKPATPQAP